MAVAVKAGGIFAEKIDIFSAIQINQRRVFAFRENDWYGS